MVIEIATIQEVFQVTPLQAQFACSLLELGKHKASARIQGSLSLCFPKTNEWIGRCYSTPTPLEIVMEALNELLECHGVEGLYVSDGSPLPDDFFGSYLNVGDTYKPTLCYVDREFKISSWGDEVEKREREIAENS